MRSTFNKLLVVIIGLSMAASFAYGQQPRPVSDTNSAGNSKSTVIPEAWPSNVQIERLSDIGKHKAVIFSPDFAQPGNREFYERLGFFYIQNASWNNALSLIIARNYWHPEDRIETIILETHGTNGNGLKLQAGPFPKSPRSYISIGALQERLEGLGVRLCVIGACNAGRLFRPEIYKTLDPHPGDRLFLPATMGIINASPKYDPAKSKMIVVRRAASEIETTSDGDTSELSPITRSILGLEPRFAGGVARSVHFAISNLLVQMLTHDPRLKLTAEGFEKDKSRNDLTEDESDELFGRFVAFIDDLAAREHQLANSGSSAITRQPSQDQPSQGGPQHQPAGPRLSQPGVSQPGLSQPAAEKKSTRRVID